jgi:hypothetical protein
MRITLLLTLLIASVLAASPVQAQEAEPADPLALFEAYQVGFLQVVAVSCYQVYSSVGIVATDYSNGYINEETAGFALSESALLLGACSASVLEISQLTPEGDEAALAELDRLAGLLVALNELVSELDQLLDSPDDEQAAAVEDARARVEQLLDAYAASGE